MTKIAVNRILPNPEQPRKRFDKDELKELADSMQENGLVQAVTVEAMNGDYILHDGERRWRAAKMLGWTEIEANVQPPLNGAASLTGRREDRSGDPGAESDRGDAGVGDCRPESETVAAIEMGYAAPIKAGAGVGGGGPGGEGDLYGLPIALDGERE